MLFSLLVGLLSVPQAESSQELMALGMSLAREQRWEEAEDAFRRAAEADPKAAEPHLELARLSLARNEPEAALERVDEALRLAPGDFLGLFLRGSALLQLGKFPEAALEMAAALDRRPDDVNARQALAFASLRAGEPSRAVEALEPLVASGSAGPTALAMYGAGLVETERYEEAIPPLEKALESEPSPPQALLYLGQALLHTGRPEEAADRFRQGASLPPPQNIRFVLGLAESLLRQKRGEEAKGLLDELLKDYPRVARGLFLRGLIEAEKEDYTSARDAFQQAIAQGHGTPETYLNLGVAEAALGDRTAARASLDRAIAGDPQLAAAYYHRGIIEYDEGDPREAVELLETAARLEPGEPRTFLALAEAYLKIGRLEQALAAAEKAVGDEAAGAPSFYVKGLVHHERLEYPQAEEAYRKALSLGLDSAELHLNLARALYGMARHEEARAEAREALARDAGGEGHLLLGKTSLELRDYDAAHEHLVTATELLPDSADAWYRLGVAQSRRGRSEEALSSWRRAIALDPDLLDAYYRLGSELMKAGRSEEGERVLEEFRERSAIAERKEHQKVRLRTTLRRALELADKGRHEEALRFFREAVDIAPDDPLVYLHLGDFHAARGEAADAEAILLEGISKIPDSLSLHEALLSVYEATGNRTAAHKQRMRVEELKRSLLDARRDDRP